MIIGLLNIDLELPDMEEIENHFDDALNEGMDQLVEEIEWEWRKTAKEVLMDSNTTITGNKYLEGFAVERVGNDIQVILHGLGAAMEMGTESYDLKPGFLAKGKAYSGGLYRVIPMGHRSTEIGPPRFRTVTSTSNGWIHPGFGTKPEHSRVSVTAIENIKEKIIPEIFDKLMGNAKI